MYNCHTIWTKESMVMLSHSFLTGGINNSSIHYWSAIPRDLESWLNQYVPVRILFHLVVGLQANLGCQGGLLGRSLVWDSAQSWLSHGVWPVCLGPHLVGVCSSPVSERSNLPWPWLHVRAVFVGKRFLLNSGLSFSCSSLGQCFSPFSCTLLWKAWLHLLHAGPPLLGMLLGAPEESLIMAK